MITQSTDELRRLIARLEMRHMRTRATLDRTRDRLRAMKAERNRWRAEAQRCGAPRRKMVA